MPWPCNPRDRRHGRATSYATPSVPTPLSSQKNKHHGDSLPSLAGPEQSSFSGGVLEQDTGPMGMPGGQDAVPHSANTVALKAERLLGTNNHTHLGPDMRDRTQNGVAMPRVPKGNRFCSSKNALWLPEHMAHAADKTPQLCCAPCCSPHFQGQAQ